MSKKKITVFDVANYFLKCQDEKCGDMMSNMKIQKLVYYAQGFHLAYTGNPLFDEPIVAWPHGPVCPDLYEAFKVYDGKPIPIPHSLDISEIFDEETIYILDKVHERYGQYSAWKLRNLSHEETPWRKAFYSFDNLISVDSIKEYFKSILIDNEEDDDYELIEDKFVGNRACLKENSLMNTLNIDCGPITWTREELYERKSLH